ncbi:SIMPL domain-containing protein [Pontibacter sp. JH31]|uniref:SIMPL domain-containing protein n=1 Tax=Pontibacter aquaedesilientis TaxID=2766980 RepID=A0ABR7XCA5_9BACT|nr:SIMPL domain-containing protein [Pontibacter aquaedesilientis]MBD1395935.1 SIMPL domain-containing protein [Pontibacter aquaedesilientis]
MRNNSSLVMAAVVLGISLLLCMLLFVTFWHKRATQNQTITVTGSAKREITSDFGILRGNIQASAPSAEAAYQSLQRQRPLVVAYLQKQGFKEENISLTTINLNPIYELSSQGYQTNNIARYQANQMIEVRSNDVNRIREVSLAITELVSQGVDFSVMPPEYYYSGLADLKIEIQADAARDALNRAQKIAEATGSELGPITNARMGVLQITPVNSNMVSDYGINDVSSIEKEITAVVNASFRLD